MAWSQKQNKHMANQTNGETRGITKHSSDQNEKCLLDRRDLNTYVANATYYVASGLANATYVALGLAV